MSGRTRKRRSKKRSRRLRGGNDENLIPAVIKLLEAFSTNKDNYVLDLVKHKIKNKEWFKKQCNGAEKLLRKVGDQSGSGRKKRTRNNRRTRKKRGGQSLMAFAAARILGLPGLIVVAAAMYCWRTCRDAAEEHRQRNLPPPTAEEQQRQDGARYADYGYHER